MSFVKIIGKINMVIIIINVFFEVVLFIIMFFFINCKVVNGCSGNS